MRLWHKDLIPYLPELQFKGQLREMVAILHDLKRNGKTNHLLINRIMEYPKDNLYWYFCQYEAEYHTRYGKNLCEQAHEFGEFGGWCFNSNNGLFDGWHNTEYLRVCMANLYEKHYFGVGKSRITDQDWKTLCDGYEKITGEPYKI